MSVSKQEKGLCAWNEEKHFAVRSWRLTADFTWRTEVVASASFCKFPTVICKFRLHSMYFFFYQIAFCILSGREFNRVAFCTNADLFRIPTAQWTTNHDMERCFLSCLLSSAEVGARLPGAKRDLTVRYPAWYIVQWISRMIFLQVVRRQLYTCKRLSHVTSQAATRVTS